MSLWFVVVILGIIEGITEFLPISSTGHLLIAEHLFGRQSELFTVVIQSGAVIAVLPLFPERLHQFLFRWREKATQDYLLKIFVAFALTGAVGLILDKKGFKLPDNPILIATALFLGGVAFIAIERWLRDRQSRNEITWPMVFAVALGQILAAVFPGTSRSGATIILALILGLNRVAATEFTFLVGIPTMLAAGGWKILKELRHPGGPSENWGMLLLGCVVAAFVSFLAVKWLLRYVQTHTFVAFGWYRIGLAILIAGLVILVPEKRKSPAPPPSAKALIIPVFVG